MNRFSISVSQPDSETVEEQGYQTTDQGTSRAYQTQDDSTSRAYQTGDAASATRTRATHLAPLAD